MTTTVQGSLAPAGWYTDPRGSGGERFFDGVRWTTAVRPLHVPAIPTAALPAAQASSPPKPPRPDGRAPRGHDRRRFDAVVSDARSFLRPNVDPVVARRWVRSGASAVIVLSIAALAFAVWETLGSNVYAHQAQSGLLEEFRAQAAAPPAPLLERARSVTASQVTAALSSSPAAAPEQRPVPPQLPTPGDIGGRILIPAIGVDQVVLSGTDVETLKKGPGIWLDGVFPGAPGNATLSGHRTTYGGPFRHIDQLGPGDLITWQTPGRPDAVFEVRGSQVVRPTDVSVTGQGPGVRLTLTTCEPVGSDAARLVVQAELVSGEFAGDALPAESWQFRS